MAERTLFNCIYRAKKVTDKMRSSAMGVVSGSTVTVTQLRNLSVRKHTVHVMKIT